MDFCKISDKALEVLCDIKIDSTKCWMSLWNIIVLRTKTRQCNQSTCSSPVERYSAGAGLEVVWLRKTITECLGLKTDKYLSESNSSWECLDRVSATWTINCDGFLRKPSRRSLYIGFRNPLGLMAWCKPRHSVLVWWRVLKWLLRPLYAKRSCSFPGRIFCLIQLSPHPKRLNCFYVIITNLVSSLPILEFSDRSHLTFFGFGTSTNETKLEFSST